MKLFKFQCLALVFSCALAGCSAGSKAKLALDHPSASVEHAPPRFDPLAASSHIQEADQALRALSEDVAPERRANLHLRFAATLHLLGSPELASSYLDQVRQRDPALATLLDPLEAKLDASMPAARERYLAASSRDARRLVLTQQFEPVKYIDPVMSSLLDVSLPYDQIAALTSPGEALFVLEQQTGRELAKARTLALRGEVASARAILEQIDEEVFSHQMLGMDRSLRTTWVEVATRLHATSLISASMQRELPLYFDEQTPAAERSRGLLLGCQLLTSAALYEDAMRYCMAGKKLSQSQGRHGTSSQSRYVGDQREVDLLAEAGYTAAMALGRFEDAQAFVSLHDDAAWRATRQFELFEAQVFRHLRAMQKEKNFSQDEVLREEADALTRFARDMLGLEEQVIAALLLSEHTRGDAKQNHSLDTLFSKTDASEMALFALSPGPTLALQIRAHALLVAVAREVGFAHEALSFEAMERAHESQKDELPDQPAYHALIIELEQLDVAQRQRASDFATVAQISDGTLRMADTIVATDGNRGLELDVPDIAPRLQRAPTLILAWLSRLKRAGHMVAFLNQFQRGGVEILAGIPSSKIEELLRIVRWLEVQDEQARIVLIELLLEQLGHEPQVRAYAAEQIWSAWSLREVPLERTLSLYEKWLTVQMDHGVSVAALMDETSREVADEGARHLASQRILSRLFDAPWLAPEVDEEVLTRLEREVVLSSSGRYVVARAKLAALRARIGECEAVAEIDAALFEAFPPALSVVVRACRDEVASGALHAWLMTRTDEEARALRELVFELLYGSDTAARGSRSL